MNDAYTIGLTLALDDGVSAGIASIRRELSALDQAVVVSIVNLTRLQDVARVAITASVASAGATAATTRDFAVKALRQAKPAEITSEASPAATAPSPAARNDVPATASAPKFAQVAPVSSFDSSATALPVASQLVPDTRPTATPPTRQEPPPAAAGNVQEVVRQSTAPRLIAHSAFDPRSIVAPPAPTPATAAAPPQDQQKTPAPAAPWASARKMEQPAAVAAPTQVTFEAVSTAPVLPTASEVGKRDHPSAPPVQSEAVKVQPVPCHRPQQQVSPAPSMAPAGRGTLIAPLTERPRGAQMREPVTSTAPRQHVERSRDRSMSGTIMIDGTELGRWMADYMAHAASRPPVGGVGFDPRMSPVWAGAPIGA